MGGRKAASPYPPENGGETLEKIGACGELFVKIRLNYIDFDVPVTARRRRKIFTFVPSKRRFSLRKSCIFNIQMSTLSDWQTFSPHNGGRILLILPPDPRIMGEKHSRFSPQTPEIWGRKILKFPFSPPPIMGAGEKKTPGLYERLEFLGDAVLKLAVSDIT